MFFVGPRPYPIGEANIPLVYNGQWWMRALPNGGWWTLKYVLVSYPSVEATVKMPELSYQLFDEDGRAFMVNPVSLAMATSPAGAKGLNGTGLINVRYKGGSGIRMRIFGRNADGPSKVSVTLFGIRSAEWLGG